MIFTYVMGSDEKNLAGRCLTAAKIRNRGGGGKNSGKKLTNIYKNYL
jgi:hypothetical protein